MTTPQSNQSIRSASCSSPQRGDVQYNHTPPTPTSKAPPALPRIRFPSTSSESRPAISPSSSASSASSWISNEVRDRPPTPPSNPTKGFRLPRFSLWGRNTPDTLLSDSASSLSPPPNVVAGLDKLHITKQRAHSLQASTNAQRLAFEADSPSQPLPLPASTAPMPALTFNDSAALSPMSSPKIGTVWRIGGGLFASSSASKEPRKARPQTADPTTPRDTTIVPPASQFAAWSELMHNPPQPNRSTTFSSISSASCSSGSRPNIKKIRSQESIRSVASARPADLEPSTSYSIIPAPKPTKTKLRSKSKAGKELDFERVFLAQELHAPCPSSASRAGSIARMGTEPKSPSLAQTEFSATPSPESRRKRASWAARRSTSPQASLDRPSSDMMCSQPRTSITRSSVDHQDGEAQSSYASTFPQRGRIDRQLSTSSHITTASSATTSTNASDTLPPKSPILGANNACELDQPEDAKAKRSKSVTPKRKTYALQFSLDGRYLAAAGSDHLIRVYEVLTSPCERSEELELAQWHRIEETCHKKLASTASQTSCPTTRSNNKNAHASELAPVFKSTPIHVFAGHAGDVLDLSWSKNNFLLSCSSDKTAKLWHPNRADCLCTFTTSAIVSSVDFHPTDDRFFVTGGLDGKLRLWNISARRVQSISDVPGVITAVAFSSSGSVVCVGTHAGTMLTFTCHDALTHVHTVTVKSTAASKSTQASKITSIQPIKLGVTDAESSGPPDDSSSAAEYMTVTSNDSRVRIYSIASRRLISRFKSASYLNRSSQIRATASCDSQFIVSGSEDASIHVWSLASNAPLLASLFPGIKRNKPNKSADVGDNSTWRSWQAGSGSVRCAVFAPAATNQLLASIGDPLMVQQGSKEPPSRIIVSTDDSNAIKVWRTDPAGRLI